jgi:hypothetical protein
MPFLGRSYVRFLLGVFLRSFALIVCLCGLAVAQSSLTGAIGGTVLDAQRAAVKGARIDVANLESGERAEARSEASGSFRIGGLRPGMYSLRAESDGFAEFRILHVAVEVGRITEIEVVFAVAGAHEQVEVREEAPAVNTSAPDFATNIDDGAINNLPINGRRWSNFALLTPTATLDGDFGLISFRGISGLMNNSTIDGADNNNAFWSEERGRTRISYVISQAAVREFQVNTANFSSEYGRAAGAVVNAVTHSGTNHLRGHIFYYDRDNTLGATNAFTRVPVQTTAADGSTSWTSKSIKPLDRRQQFGGSVGGPIIKDKLFYFGNVDVQRRDYPAVAAAADTASFLGPPCVNQNHLNQIINTDSADQNRVKVCSRDEINTLITQVMPLGSTNHDAINAFYAGLNYLAGFLGTVPRTADHQIFFGKIDARISRSQALSFSFNRQRWSSPGGVQSEPVVNRGIDSFGFDGVKTDMLTARLASVLTTHLSNELRYSWSRDFEYQLPQRPLPGEPLDSNGLTPAISVLGDSSGFVFGTPDTMPRKALPDEYRNELAESLSWMHGRHLLKAGLDFNRVHDDIDNLMYANGSYSYSRRDYFIADLCQWQQSPLADEYCGSRYGLTSYFRGYSSFTQGYGMPAFGFNTYDSALFLQDEWRALRRLTLSLGLRYEYERLPGARLPNPLLPASSSLPSDGNNFGPRFGFAWNLTGDGKTSLRGGYGIYYGRINNSTISSALANTGTAAAQRSVRYSYHTSLPCLPAGPIFPGVNPADPILSGPVGSACYMGGDVAVFAHNMQTPQIHQADLILERQVARNTVFSASYLLSLGRELPNYTDTNLDPNSRQNVTYTFAPDYYTGIAGPYNGLTLTVPVYTRRLNPSFESITAIRSNVNSSYNALVLQLNRTMSSGLDFRLNYTWSHALDFGQSSTTFTANNNTLSPDPFSYTFNGAEHQVRHPDYGSSNFDIRQRFVGSLFWTPRPIKRSRGFARAALDHWTLAPIVQISTGRPFSDDVSGDSPIGTVLSAEGMAFTCAGCTGFMGTGGQSRLPFLGRNSFRYGNLYNTDLRLSRRIYFGEGRDLELAAEAFNLFNHQIITDRDNSFYSVYNSTLEYDSSFQQPTAAANTIYREREIQLGARLYF